MSIFRRTLAGIVTLNSALKLEKSKPSFLRPFSVTKLAYTIPEAAEAASLSVRTINRFISRRELPHVKIGHRTVIRVEDLANFINERVIV